MIADVIAAFTGAYKCESYPTWEYAPAGFVKDFAESGCRMYVRLSGSRTEILESAALLFGDVEIPDGTPAGKTEFITPLMTERAVRDAVSSLPGNVESVIRML